MGNDGSSARGQRSTGDRANTGGSRLIKAVTKQDIEAVKNLVKSGKADLDAVERGDTALTLAIKLGNLQLVKVLTQAGANVNCIKSSTEDQWLLPLKVAVQQHQPSIVEYLLQNGSHVNFKESTRGGIEFLKAAVAETGTGVPVVSGDSQPKMSIRILDMLIRAGSNLDAVDPHGHNIFHFCCNGNHYSAATCLLKHGDSGQLQRLNALSGYGELPVMLALSRQHEPLACLLVRQGCDIDTDSRSGHGLLSVAVEHGCLEFAKLVLSRGYDVNKKNQITGNTALCHALLKQNRSAVEFLLGSGADVHVVNNEGQTPLFVAVKRNDLDLFNVLVEEYGAKCDVADNKRRNLLHTAAHFGHQLIMESILKQVGDDLEDFVNRVDIAKKTSLHIAVSNGHLATAETLLANGARVNMVDQFGNSPLFQAISFGRNDVIEILLSAGAAVDQYNIYGKGPLHAAIAYPKLDIGALTLLLKANVDPINLDSFLDFLTERGIFQSSELLDENLVKHLKSTPKPLKHWCRCVIRARLPEQRQYTELKNTIEKLTLPLTLRQYLGVQFL